MKRKVCAITALLMLVIAPFVAVAQRQADDATTQLQKLNRFYRYLHGMYVDSVAMAPIVESAIRGMLEELDPHSAYLDAEEMKAAEETMQGSFSGIGIEYNIHNDSIIVVNTIVQGPADKAGLQPNDRIVEIDGDLCYFLNGRQTPDAGLVKFKGDYYFIDNAAKAVTNTTMQVTDTNGLLTEGTYTFGADGKLVL